MSQSKAALDKRTGPIPSGGLVLTDTKVRQARARQKPYKLADEGGLYLYVSTSGAKSWRYDYRLDGQARDADHRPLSGCASRWG